MIMTEEVTNNRDNLIYAIALVEDISRTNNRIHDLLKRLINNPQELTNIKTSIDDLHHKITNLKNSDIKTPLIDKEEVIVPIANLDYKPTPEPEEDVVEKVEEEVKELVEEPVEKPPQKRRNTRTKRPRRPLRNKKNQTETDLQDK